METTAKRAGTFDDAWWPRTRDLKSRLLGLLTVLTARLAPIAISGSRGEGGDDGAGQGRSGQAEGGVQSARAGPTRRGRRHADRP
ncbi:DUF5994 family protein [Streptomyces sp. NBC_01340]|uniref:DUF5994 family protein n=1 Tax=unclassified Streptomyces TaxID=2593676 RepID=UPI002254A88C|nr:MULTISPECIES: DUF5994 family protein [unclassified Streptomyces]MCX4458313.1 DUF5994 family protein [Streptomyces sp. NBC_01719]MCX4497670.1 DUF5994 family protein [Streptomyces sp. NBC_01728]WSI44433.1 DUF5994 family protein [Streptomyces sp. NBC_01340]